MRWETKYVDHFKADGTSNIFGGFTNVAWSSPSVGGEYKRDRNAFLFSLVNQENHPIKIKVSQPQHAFICHPSYGPSFGRGSDIFIAPFSNTNAGSYSNLGSSYSHPQYSKGSAQAQNFLAGSFNFKMSEIEVYTKT